MQTTANRIALRTGVTLNVYQAGAGADVLLLHGTGDSGIFWGVQMAQLVAAGYRVTAPDGRGHGESDRMSDYSTAVIVADAIALIDALQLHKPIVIGHSMGGVQALTMAVQHPTTVACAILEDPALLADAWSSAQIDPARAVWRHELETWQAMSFAELVAFKQRESPHWSDAAMQQWAFTKMHVDPNVLQWLDELNVPLWSWVRPTGVPIHLLYCEPHGGEPSRVDGVIPPDFAVKLAHRLPTLSMTCVPNTGHYIRHDQPDAFLNAVMTFLRAKSLLP